MGQLQSLYWNSLDTPVFKVVDMNHLQSLYWDFLDTPVLIAALRVGVVC